MIKIYEVTDAKKISVLRIKNELYQNFTNDFIDSPNIQRIYRVYTDSLSKNVWKIKLN